MTTMMATPRKSLPSVRLRPELGFEAMSLNSGSFSKLADMDVAPDSPYAGLIMAGEAGYGYGMVISGGHSGPYTA
jgi:hypothetical protein